MQDKAPNIDMSPGGGRLVYDKARRTIVAEIPVPQWKEISERLPWDQQPGHQFIRVEGSREHSGAKWHRVRIGEAMARRLDDPEAVLGFRAADIVRICDDGDMDLHTAVVTHWMPAKWPAVPNGAKP